MHPLYRARQHVFANEFQLREQQNVLENVKENRGDIAQQPEKQLYQFEYPRVIYFKTLSLEVVLLRVGGLVWIEVDGDEFYDVDFLYF